MYFIKTPWWLRKLYSPALTWSIPNNNNEVYLTFDDGPHPIATPYVLDCLKQHDAKATFFCIGKNVRQYPEIYSRIIDEGHAVGNHTFEHLNGWKVNDKLYLDDVFAAQNLIDTNLFRPPYGRISRSQIHQLKSIFRLIMWDVLSGDFDTLLSGDQCFKNVAVKTKTGSIIVFHDSEKAFPRLEYALPCALKLFEERKLVMKALSL